MKVMQQRVSQTIVSEDSSDITITLEIFDSGRGLCCYLFGGDSPHVGGVVLATPRPSLRDSEEMSADISSLTVSGHLDNEVGVRIAKTLSKALGVPVSVTSGIHVDNASPLDINVIESVSETLAITCLVERGVCLPTGANTER